MQTTVAVTPEALAGDLARIFRYLQRSATDDPLHLQAQLELSISQIRALMLLDRCLGEEGTLGDLAEGMPLSPAATSRAVDGLLRAGLVTRHEDASDRRVKRVAITPAGREIVAQLIEARMAVLRDFTQMLGDEERTALATALRPILARPEVAAGSEGCG